jgi:hypothetical protein
MTLRSQSRLASLAESLGNIAVGLGIQMLGAHFAFKFLGVRITGSQFVWFTVLMTFLSVARSYCLRRLWNAEWWKNIPWRSKYKKCRGCGNKTDPEWCWCGGACKDHGYGTGHAFVPMGCTCGYYMTKDYSRDHP